MSTTFIRHAESIFNAIEEDIVDCNITIKGISHANKLKGTYDIVICSPLLRCKNTLKYSSIKYNDIYYMHEVREFIEDNCDLLKNEDFKQETKESVKQRISSLFNYIHRHHAHKNICVITHSMYMWHLTKLKGDPLMLDNTESYTIKNNELIF